MCEHKNLKTVNDRLFCQDCGAELPLELLIKEPKKKRTKKEKAE